MEKRTDFITSPEKLAKRKALENEEQDIIRQIQKEEKASKKTKDLK